MHGDDRAARSDVAVPRIGRRRLDGDPAFDLAFWAAEKRRHLLTPNLVFSHRPIELGSLLAGSDGLPTSSKHAVKSILDKPVSHDALEDARDARRLYLHWYENIRRR